MEITEIKKILKNGIKFSELISVAQKTISDKAGSDCMVVYRHEKFPDLLFMYVDQVVCGWENTYHYL